MHVVLDRSCRPQHEQTLTQEQEHGTMRAHIHQRHCATPAATTATAAVTAAATANSPGHHDGTGTGNKL